ncbi:MAG: DNA repair protein RecN [Eubacterium sp.]|nr:DNA repair protein RecN [Eubacterium sp.]
MITNLHVKNLALIDEADVSFRPGLNILTGETGAGKSILLGSIDLALGQKMSGDILRSGTDHALVELVFEIEDPEILHKLKELEVETEDGILVLSRRVTDGRSLCRLNGETCTVSRLRQISSLLLDIHGQHEHQSLLYPERQLAILDAYGKERLQELLHNTAEAYETWKTLGNSLDEFSIDECERQRELSLLEYEIKEIEEAALQPGEDEALEKEYRRMANAQKIAEALQAVHQLTGEESAGDSIGRAVRELNGITGIDSELQEVAAGLVNIENLLADFNREVSLYQEKLTFSEAEFYQTEKRLNQLNTLKSRYGRTLEEVLQYLERQKEKQERFEQFDERKTKAEQAFRKAEMDLDKASAALSEERQRIAGELSGKIVRELQDLNFLSVSFCIDFIRSSSYHKNGYDEICFQISTNPGEAVKPLNRVVSGGELSRIMLAIKTLLADKDHTETLLFDEIDTGVSGRTAQKVAEKMARIARTHQVLCVTHLAQLAAMADHHFLIYKDVAEGSTQTHIEKLSQEQSAEEIARILGGAEITEAVRKNAKEMLELAWEKKRSEIFR